MEKLVFNGLINYPKGGDFWDIIHIGNRSFTKEIFDESRYNENLMNSKIFLKYFISDKPIDEEKVIESYVKKLYGIPEQGSGFYYLVGTELTGWYGNEESFVLQGHNLIQELETNLGKYCLLIIEFKDIFQEEEPVNRET